MIKLDRLSWFMGETARPFTLFMAGGSSAVATIQTAIYNANTEGALFVAACWAGVAALFHSKGWEEQKKAGQMASVAIAQATSAAPGSVVVEPPHGRVTVEGTQ